MGLLRIGAVVLFGALLCVLAVASTAGAVGAESARQSANGQFVEAMRLIDAAQSTYDLDEEARLLRQADSLLRDIVDRFPDSIIAVQLVTNQFIGDFDVYEFRNRIRALVCNEATANACFLYRIEAMLPPVERPVANPRWDWLSLAVSHSLFGDPERAPEIIAPFLSAVRRNTAGRIDGDLFVARALALTGRIDLALEVTRSFDDCATRIYNLTDIADAALWREEEELAMVLIDEAKDYATRNACTWELGLIAQGLIKTGREAVAHTLFLNTVEEQLSRFKGSHDDCCPPELAVAAADLGDVNLALNLLRTVEDENPWAVPTVLGRLALRGETGLAVAYAEQVIDVELRAESYFELLASAVARDDIAAAQDMMDRLNALIATAPVRPALLIQRAKGEKLMDDGDDRWRTTFVTALGVAENSSAFVRRDIGVPLLAALVRIETGLPLLD